MEIFDLAIIGAGPGGYVAAIRAAQLGAKVAVAEMDELGGVCLNRGCIPSKVLISAADLFRSIKKADKFGINLYQPPSIDLEILQQRKEKIVSNLVKGIYNLFKNHHIRFFKGRAILLDEQIIQINTPQGDQDRISAKSIIIATGSSSIQLPGIPFDGQNIINSDQALMVRKIPSSILIIGAGAIGCEFACFYNSFGTKVTLIEMLPRPVPFEEEEISHELEREFKKQGIKLITDDKVVKVEKLSDQQIKAITSKGQEILTEQILVSVGRIPNSRQLGLESVGVSLDDKGRIIADRLMRTTNPRIFAIGDVLGKYMLAHSASAEGIVAAENAMGMESIMDYSAIPSAIFTHPEIGSVGLREQEAINQGMKIKTGYFRFRAMGKAMAMEEIAGFVKVVASKDDERVLGVHIIGPVATELLHIGGVAIRHKLTIKQLYETVYAHPTLSEVLKEAAMDVDKIAIHSLEKD